MQIFKNIVKPAETTISQPIFAPQNLPPVDGNPILEVLDAILEEEEAESVEVSSTFDTDESEPEFDPCTCFSW